MVNQASRLFVRVSLVMGLLLLLSSSCKKEEQPTEIPYVLVNFSLNPNSTEYYNLNSVNGWETVTGGYNGILIFRKTIEEFAAYERACPYDPLKPGAQVKVDASGITCYCPVCGSKYILVDGTPYEGPSRYTLKPYSAVYDGTMLYISN
jgi:nitrite reductase/ring-hydroxylating ferredoxin subunit